MITICAILTLIGSFYFGCEVSGMAFDRLEDRERSMVDIVKDELANALVFLVCASGVITSLYTLWQLWFR